MMCFPSITVAGVRVDCPRFVDAVDWVRERVATRSGGYVCHVNTHSIVEAQNDVAMARALGGATLALPDGMPLVWAARRRGVAAERLYGPAFMRAVLQATQGGECRHFLYGSTPTVLAALEGEIARAYPGAVICGTLSPPFRPSSPEETQAQIDAIQASGADVVWVGLGAPRQEQWMAAFCHRLPGQMLLGVGAAFDFLAGSKRQAPVWMQRAGLEWAFRWGTEPRRLSGRYGRVIPAFLWLSVRDWWFRRQDGAK